MKNWKAWVGRLLPIALNVVAAVLELSGANITWWPTVLLSITTLGQLILGEWWKPRV